MSETYKVYLSGPITGLSYDNAIGWTDYAKEELAKFGITGYRPLRGKKHLSKEKDLKAVVIGKNPMSTNKAIVSRDSYDVISSDCILVNLLGSQRISIGTVAEIAWAWLLRKPIVLVMEKEGNLHHHGFILEMCGHQTDNLDEGIQMVKNILLDE